MAKFFVKTAEKAGNFNRGVLALFKKQFLEADFYEGLEDLLLEADLGPKISLDILAKLKIRSKKLRLSSAKEVFEQLELLLVSYLKDAKLDFVEDQLSVFMIVGINGVGKTTSLAKLAQYLAQKASSRIVLGAGDTFRAAATEQLKLHSERLGLRLVSQSQGADPAAVIYDTVNSALARKDDFALIDTAGRMHNRDDLMRELQKIDKVLARLIKAEQRKNIIVIDSTTGQNAYNQVEVFKEVMELDGAILSKCDSSGAGGIAINISHNLEVPFLFAGFGESYQDLEVFDKHKFVKNLIYK